MYFAGYVLLVESGLHGKNLLKKLYLLSCMGRKLGLCNQRRIQFELVLERRAWENTWTFVKQTNRRTKMFNDDLHNLYPPQNIRAITTRTLPWKGSTARMEVHKNKYSISVRKPEGKSSAPGPLV